MAVERIPVAKPDLNGNEERYAVEAIRSSWISSSGEFINRFEREFAASVDAPVALTVSNGTVALYLALLALDVRPGDEVIIPSMTFIATANAVRFMGATPVFVDVDPDTWCLDPKLLEGALSRKTKGIITVHLYGHPSDMDAINDFAAVHGLWVVEDAAEAHFARYKGRPVGGLGNIGTFSFYGNKVLTSGEGGAVILRDRSLETRAKMLRGQGMDPKRRYYFPIVGHNFRLTNVSAALLCAQLERGEALLAKRRQIVESYTERLIGIPGIVQQPVAEWAEPTPWLYSVMIDQTNFGMSRDDLAIELDRAGIETRPFFIPISDLPPYRHDVRIGSPLTYTKQMADRGINLPTFTELTIEQIERITEAIHKAYRKSFPSFALAGISRE